MNSTQHINSELFLGAKTFGNLWGFQEREQGLSPGVVKVGLFRVLPCFLGDSEETPVANLGVWWVEGRNLKMEKLVDFLTKKLRCCFALFKLSLGKSWIFGKKTDFRSPTNRSSVAISFIWGIPCESKIPPHVSLHKAKTERNLYFWWQIAPWGGLGGAFPR